MADDKPEATAGGGRCPICKAPTEPRYRPFCSRRCADVDLARWLRGAYAIPGGNTAADEDGDDAAAQAASGGEGERRDEDE